MPHQRRVHRPCVSATPTSHYPARQPDTPPRPHDHDRACDKSPFANARFSLLLSSFLFFFCGGFLLALHRASLRRRRRALRRLASCRAAASTARAPPPRVVAPRGGRLYNASSAGGGVFDYNCTGHNHAIQLAGWGVDVARYPSHSPNTNTSNNNDNNNEIPRARVACAPMRCPSIVCDRFTNDSLEARRRRPAAGGGGPRRVDGGGAPKRRALLGRAEQLGDVLRGARLVPRAARPAVRVEPRDLRLRLGDRRRQRALSCRASAWLAPRGQRILIFLKTKDVLDVQREEAQQATHARHHDTTVRASTVWALQMVVLFTQTRPRHRGADGELR